MLHRTQDFLVLEELPQTQLRKDKLPWALGIFVGIIIAASFERSDYL